jgi:hypothetical protein
MDTVRTIKVHFSLQRTNLHLTCMPFFAFFLMLFYKVIVFYIGIRVMESIWHCYTF